MKKCKGHSNWGDKCKRDAVWKGYCIMHYNKFVLNGKQDTFKKVKRK